MENQLTITAEPNANTVQPTDQLQQADQPDIGRETTTARVLWGVAVLGLLPITMRLSGLTQAQIYQVWRGPHGGNYQLLKWTHLLVDNAMPALVFLLFGAGILPFLTRSKATAGFAVPELYIRGSLWLLALGIFNAYVFLSPNDLLFHIGIVAVFLFPLQRLSGRGFLIAALLTGLFFSGKGYWNYSDMREKYTKYERVAALEKKNKKAKLTDEQKDDKSAWEGTVKGMAYDQEKDKTAIATTRSESYGETWNFLVPRFQNQQAWQFYQRKIWEITSLMLLGMALFRWGFFTNRLTTGQYLAVAVGGLLVSQVLAWVSIPSYESAIVDYAKFISSGTLPLYELLPPLERAFAAVGWAGAIMCLYQVGTNGLFSRALGAVGQLALTNFLMQSLLLSFFFYGYGMSYFGSIRLQYLYVVVAEIWLFQLVFSVVWLRNFSSGPAEWLWKSLTYNRKEPIRLPNTSAVPS
ncbi:DUF418 domain-containing protein [Fibrella sp. USSR17]